ncbi:MAG: MFS transporter [Pseudomonadota bacterium]
MDPRLISIYASAGILLGANGLIVTLIAIRADLEGMPDSVIGFLGAGYFFGFFASCFWTPTLIRRAGHIRVFAALAALYAITTLSIVLWVDAAFWVAMRVVGGFCSAGIATVIESWLNHIADNKDRARVLSMYRVVDLTFVTAGQFMMPVIGVSGFEIFAVTAILFCLAIIPVSLSRQHSPPPPDSTRLRPLATWALSPTACIGCVIIGLTNGAFRTVGPIYAREIGLGVDDVALFVSLSIVAAAVCQYPLGAMSDRIGRRIVLLGATAVTIASSLFLFTLGRLDPIFVFIGGMLFGGFALPLYSLSIAHAADFAKPGEFVELSVGLVLFYTLGAIFGPLISSGLISNLGPAYFFAYTGAVHSILVAFILYRMTRRMAVSRSERGRFVGMLRTSPLFSRMATGRSDASEQSKKVPDS